MTEQKDNFWSNLQIVFGLVAVLWVVFLLTTFNIIDATAYANWPRHIEGLKGILFSPFLHGSMEHLVSNTLPLLVLFTVLLNAYPRVALFVLVFIHLLSGAMVWLLAPPTGLHIGASGVIYGVAGFLVASGVFRRDRTSISIAILVTLVYGGMVAGFIPTRGVSWQSHFFGALSGVVVAFMVRRVDVPPPHPYQLEKSEPEVHFFDDENTHK